MVATRRAQASATPPVTPSATIRYEDTPGSSIKMSKEMRRLMIDGNEKMCGPGSSASKRSSRSSNIQPTQPLEDSPAVPQSAARQEEGRTQNKLFNEGGVILTPPGSDSPKSVLVQEAATTTATAPAESGHVTQPRLPSPVVATRDAPAHKGKRQPSPLRQTAAPSTKTPTVPTLTRKRTINDYFNSAPSTKRVKVDSPVHDIAVAKEENEVEIAAAGSGDVTSSKTTVQDDAQSVTVDAKDPTQEEDVTVEDGAKVGQSEEKQEVTSEPTEKESQPEPEPEPAQKEPENQPEELTEKELKRRIRAEKELARLQIDANAAMQGFNPEDSPNRPKRKRQSAIPASTDHNVDIVEPPAKKVRQSLPADTSKASKETPPSPVLLSYEDMTHQGEIIPNPVVIKPAKEPRLLEDGKVNDKWLVPWLAWVAHAVGDEHTVIALMGRAEDDLALNRNTETDQEKKERADRELKFVESWPAVALAEGLPVPELEVPEEEIQKSHVLEPKAAQQEVQDATTASTKKKTKLKLKKRHVSEAATTTTTEQPKDTIQVTNGEHAKAKQSQKLRLKKKSATNDKVKDPATEDKDKGPDTNDKAKGPTTTTKSKVRSSTRNDEPGLLLWVPGWSGLTPWQPPDSDPPASDGHSRVEGHNEDERRKND